MKESSEMGVRQIASLIHARLQRYLEAQYHIRDAGLIAERRLVLEEPGGISQSPYVEVTPSYAMLDGFAQLAIPTEVRDFLSELAGWTPGVGVFAPYQHQADALKHFFSRGDDGDDLIVATGTGSGKTETFLYSILGALTLEGNRNRASFSLPGMRALLLYPMNALVSDQTARLRRFLGDERLAAVFRERWGRHPLFGMYTSRTPYPGVRNGTKDKRHLDTLVGYYAALAYSEETRDRQLVAELQRRGRWPAKDILRFYGKDLEEKKLVKSGKRAGQEQVQHRWDRRFLTQAADRELHTRHEIQIKAPEQLNTNNRS